MLSTVAALLLLASGAADRQVLTVDAAASTVRYHVKHKLHAVDGASRSVEGKAVIEPGGQVLAMVRIPVASFDSGDGNRDAHMRETLEAGRHPFVVFKGVTSGVAPAAGGKPATYTLAGELDFHGVKRHVDVPVSIEFARDGSASVRGKFDISIEAYGVERPSLLFVKLDDLCTIDFDLRMKP